MAQFARPDSTVVAGGWTVGDSIPSPTLWDAVDEVTPDDATTHDRTTFRGTGETMELGLSTIVDPAVSTGHIVRARFERSGPAGGVHDVFLFQGGTQIAALGSTADPVAWATDSFTLTGTETDNITDYGNLRIKIFGDNTAGGNRTLCTWVELEVPDAPAADERHQTRRMSQSWGYH